MKSPIHEIIVIGGGPAGMMAAGRAAELGAKVLLIEKNDTLGKKLLITGGGRCNVTNAELDHRKLLEKFKNDGKYLFSAISQWDVEKTLAFFHERNMPTKVENEKRVFPVSNSAQSVWDVMVGYIKNGGVEVISNHPVIKIVKNTRDGSDYFDVQTKNGKIFTAKKLIIATGGTSRPETGSTGDGYAWLRDLGHTVVEATPSLVPLSSPTPWVHKLAGISLPDVKITTFQNDTKQESKRGKILFTHFGLSGPTILNMSKDIGELIKYGEVIICLDPLPDLDYGMLNTKLQQLLQGNPKMKIKNILAELLPSALITPALAQAEIPEDTVGNSVTRDQRNLLTMSLKKLLIEISGLLGEDKAIITSGGVHLDEVDFRTMQSKIHPNLYLAGDILNIDRPSGGYSLQMCWTTGQIAGTNAAKSN